MVWHLEFPNSSGILGLPWSSLAFHGAIVGLAGGLVAVGCAVAKLVPPAWHFTAWLGAVRPPICGNVSFRSHRREARDSPPREDSPGDSGYAGFGIAIRPGIPERRIWACGKNSVALTDSPVRFWFNPETGPKETPRGRGSPFAGFLHPPSPQSNMQLSIRWGEGLRPFGGGL